MDTSTKHKKVSSIEETGCDAKRQNPWFGMIAFICIAFAIYMTMTEAQPAPAPIPVLAPGNDSQTEQEPKPGIAPDVSGQGGPRQEGDSSSSKSVLLIEDNPVFIAMTVLNIWSQCPECDIAVCCGPKDAIASLNVRRWYRIVLDDNICPDTDIVMSGGLVVLNYIKTNYPQQLSKVAVSGMGSDFQSLAVSYGCRLVAKGGWGITLLY